MSGRDWSEPYDTGTMQKDEQDAPVEVLSSTDLTVQTVQTHRWVDRGAKLSCEHAGHPYHQAWKRGVPKTEG